MSEELLIVPFRVVRSLVRAARLPAGKGTVRQGLCHIQHVLQFQGGCEVRVKGQAMIGKLDLATVP